MITQKAQTITIKPAKEGVNVLKPDGIKLKAAGEAVTRNAFWVRRLADGDVAIVDMTKAKATTTKGE